MRQLEDFETLHDYWQEVTETFRDAPYRSVPKNPSQRELAVNVSGGLSIRLVAKGVPTSLQIRETKGRGTVITKLDVAPQSDMDLGQMIFMGHLMITSSTGGEKARGLHIAQPYDMPPAARDTINEQVNMLDAVYNHWLSDGALQQLRNNGTL